jgi:hypothetical protein
MKKPSLAIALIICLTSTQILFAAGKQETQATSNNINLKVYARAYTYQQDDRGRTRRKSFRRLIPN